MATTVNTIKTRILNKYDLLANYTSSFIPLKGEICLVEIPSGTSSSGLTPPAVGIKVGDGATTFDKLQWVQAIAGDVDSFVKRINESNFPTKVKAALGYSSTDSLDAVISSINTKFNDYSTTAQMNTALGKKVDTTTLTNYQAEVTQLLAGKVDNNTFTSYQSEVSTALGKKVETSVADSAASSSNQLLAKTAIEKLIKDNASDPINTKIGNLTDLTTTDKDSIVEAINEVNAEADANATAIENLLKAVGDGADGLATKVSTLENVLPVGDFSSTNTVKKAIETAEGHIGTVGSLTTTAKTSAVAAINELDAEIGTIASLNNKKATLVEEINAVDGRVTATNGNLTTVAGQVTTLIGDDANMSVRDIAADFVADALAGGGTSFDTLQEIAAWLKDHPEDVGEINEAIQTLEALHATKEGGSFKTVAEEVAAGIAIENLSQYATNEALNSYKTTVSDTYATKTEVADTITAAGTAVQSATFAGTDLTKNGTALSISKDTARAALGYGTMADRSANDYSTTVQMNSAIGSAKDELKGGSSDTSSSATIAGAKKYADEQIAAANQNLTSEINGIKQSIEDMDYSASDDSGAMFGITQVNGKITGTTRRKIKNADLDTSDVFIFYCGNATGYDANMATVTIE